MQTCGDHWSGCPNRLVKDNFSRKHQNVRWLPVLRHYLSHLVASQLCEPFRREKFCIFANTCWSAPALEPTDLLHSLAHSMHHIQSVDFSAWISLLQFVFQTERFQWITRWYWYVRGHQWQWYLCSENREAFQECPRIFKGLQKFSVPKWLSSMSSKRSRAHLADHLERFGIFHIFKYY